MTRAEARDVLGEAVVAVILGNTLRAHFISFRLFVKYGISSVLCGEKKTLLDKLDVRCGFLQLFEKADESLTVERLSELSEFYSEQTLFILPISENGAEFLERNRKMLESGFILSRSETELGSNHIFDILKTTPTKGE